jgi:uncharacterized damage-inducible protein DinB
MPSIDMVKTFIAYHQAITRRVWDSIDQITEEQFLSDDAYSRGSIRNLMVHLANTDRNWLTGLKNLPDVRAQMKEYQEYPDRASVRAYWESVAKDLAEYLETLTEAELNENPQDIPGQRWKVLLHLVNHGTDHRSTVLQRLHEIGAPTFDQDFSIWLMNAGKK